MNENEIYDKEISERTIVGGSVSDSNLCTHQFHLFYNQFPTNISQTRIH